MPRHIDEQAGSPAPAGPRPVPKSSNQILNAPDFTQVDRLQAKLLQRATIAATKASKKRQRLIDVEELLALRVQTLGPLVRLALFVSGSTGLAIGIQRLANESSIQNIVLVTAAVALLLFALFGIRRALRSALSTIDAVDVASFTAQALRATAKSIGNLFD